MTTSTERLHPASMHELRRLIQLHGADRVRHAINEIEPGTDKLAETEQGRRGRLLINVLNLRIKPNGRVDTTWGDKTPLGLFKTVERIVVDGR